MKKLVATDIWTLRLLGLCAALGVLLLINMLWQPQAHLPKPAAAEAAVADKDEVAETPDPDTPDPSIAKALAAQTLPGREVKPLPAYGVTLQRPLFYATRRPAPVAPKLAKPKVPRKPAAPPRSNLTGIRLTGVIMTAEKAFGLLSIPGQSELMRAREGQMVKGWKVASVEEDALVLNNGEEDVRMALWEEKPGQGTATTRQTPPGRGAQQSGVRPANTAGARQ